MIKIGEGETAEVFKLDHNRVVKLFKSDFFNQDDFNIEYKTAKYMGNYSNYAPKVFEKLLIGGRTGYVMEEVTGSLFQDSIDNYPEKIEDHAKLLGSTHKSLHDHSKMSSFQYLDNFKQTFSRFFDNNQTLPAEVNHWLKTVMSSLPDDTVLLHGDFMPYNIILSDGNLKVVDWAEPMLGPAEAEIARTINFILDPTLYPDSEYTLKSQLFIECYLDGYFNGKSWNAKLLHDCLLLNSVFEYSWAVRSNQIDSFSVRTKEFIMNNFSKYGSDKLVEL